MQAKRLPKELLPERLPGGGGQRTQAMQAADSTNPGTADRESLESWAGHCDAESLQRLVERYLRFVYSSALRRTGDAAEAAEVTRAVFLVLARRARRLRKKTVLAGWLFHVTAIACRKLKQQRSGRLRRLWQWISRKSSTALPPACISCFL